MGLFSKTGRLLTITGEYLIVSVYKYSVNHLYIRFVSVKNWIKHPKKFSTTLS